MTEILGSGFPLLWRGVRSGAGLNNKVKTSTLRTKKMQIDFVALPARRELECSGDGPALLLQQYHFVAINFIGFKLFYESNSGHP